jgi:hypothetical protein
MKAAVDGSSGDGVFVAAVNAVDGMVVAASTATGQLRTTTAITAATIGQRSHHRQCHWVIAPLTNRRLCRRQPPLTKTIITVAAIDCCFCQ